MSITQNRISTACALFSWLSLCACSANDDPGNAGSGGAGNKQKPPPASLPFAVDDYFAPSGYMRDARDGNATMTPVGKAGDTTCAGSRSPVPAPRGACHTVTFTTFGAMPELTWGGVYWQYPDGNWGERAGLSIPAGATKVKFQARGAVGGEVVGFFVGGVGADGQPHGDTFKVENMAAVLTTEWASYELLIPAGTDYATGVVGGFGWGVGATDNVLPLTFYLDDIVWE